MLKPATQKSGYFSKITGWLMEELGSGCYYLGLGRVWPRTQHARHMTGRKRLKMPLPSDLPVNSTTNGTATVSQFCRFLNFSKMLIFKGDMTGLIMCIYALYCLNNGFLSTIFLWMWLHALYYRVCDMHPGCARERYLECVRAPAGYNLNPRLNPGSW